MAHLANPIHVYLEIGQKVIFAGALAWPGWCRLGRDERAALQALCDYGPRYARVLHAAQIEFQPPADLSGFVVIERLTGNATTDFGAPNFPPSDDARPFTTTDVQHAQALLRACWSAFDAALQDAAGKTLRKGPRGGGRDLETIVKHVLDADAAYLGRLAWKIKKDELEKTGVTQAQKWRASARPSCTRWPRRGAAKSLHKARAGAPSGRQPPSCAAWPGICSIISGRSRIAPKLLEMWS